MGAAMELPAERAMPAAVPVFPARTRLRRRPSGEPPALPHHLQTSGVGWLVAAVGLVAFAMLVFTRGLRGIAVDVTVADQAVARWLQQADSPAAVATFRALAWPSSWTLLDIVGPALLLVLLALRR